MIIRDSSNLMLRLAEHFGIKDLPVRKMVLVLEVGCVPTLLIEQFVCKESEKVIEAIMEDDLVQPIVVDSVSTEINSKIDLSIQERKKEDAQ